MISKSRELKRLKASVEALQDQLAEQARKSKEELLAETQRAGANETLKELAEAHLYEAKRTIDYERLQRVSAQRGLVNYMREAGLGDRIGYDPDTDPEVRKDIAEGKIPPRNDPRYVREAVRATIAARTVA